MKIRLTVVALFDAERQMGAQNDKKWMSGRWLRDVNSNGRTLERTAM